MNFLASLVAVGVLGLFAGLVAPAGAQAVFGIALPYAAMAIFVIGVVWRIVKWARIPVPFRIPTTCGQQKTLPWFKSNSIENPHNTRGVVARMALEVLFFRSLFRNHRAELEGGKLVYADTKWLWLGAIVFHYTFLILLIRHLRLFTDPVPSFVLYLQTFDGFLQIGAPVFYITTIGLLAGAGYLLIRRLLIPQVRYISLINDYFPLVLILGIAATGFLLRHYTKTDIMAIKEMAVGLVTLNPGVPDGISGWFFAHLFYVSLLLAYFPFSKLMHAGGVFLSPTRNMANNSRIKRHINPWNPEVKTHPYPEYEDEFREKMVKVGIPVDKEE